MSDAAIIEWVCETHEDRVERMFNALNLDYKGLEDVKKAYQDGDKVAACNALVSYYQEKARQNNRTLDPVAPTDKKNAAAEQILRNIFTFQNISGT